MNMQRVVQDVSRMRQRMRWHSRTHNGDQENIHDTWWTSSGEGPHEQIQSMS